MKTPLGIYDSVAKLSQDRDPECGWHHPMAWAPGLWKESQLCTAVLCLPPAQHTDKLLYHQASPALMDRIPRNQKLNQPFLPSAEFILINEKSYQYEALKGPETEFSVTRVIPRARWPPPLTVPSSCTKRVFAVMAYGSRLMRLSIPHLWMAHYPEFSLVSLWLVGLPLASVCVLSAFNASTGWCSSQDCH